MMRNCSVRKPLVVGFTFVLWLVLVGCSYTIQDPRQTDEELTGPVQVLISPNVPATLTQAFLTQLRKTPTLITPGGPQPITIVEEPIADALTIQVTPLHQNSVHLVERYFAAVVPFATVQDDITLAEVQARWQGQGEAPLFATTDAAQWLSANWGPLNATLVDQKSLLAKLEATPGAIGLLAFDQLDPSYKVLTIDGANVLNNWLDANNYPLGVALTMDGPGSTALAPLLRSAAGEFTNRVPNQLTTLLMTGVTAMSRGTAAAMARNGVLYPASVVSATFAAADITHVSNEVPFLEDCVVNNTVNNLILCSHTSYWEALRAIGTDIVGLSGNHVNDFGRDGARESLTFYQEHKIPIYGSGFTPEEACAPLRWEHNGNSFAFVAVLAFGPETAWVTATEPGACYYYERKDEILATVRQLAQEVDIVAVELQYEETYNAWPTLNQVKEFRELRAAGAEIVTGVQSHVPQALEPYGASDDGGPGIIVYGLGNLFFDQMWSWETRTELYARHTIYKGRVISTEILTGVLEDFAKPRWTTPAERRTLLNSIFAAAPPRLANLSE